MAYIDSSPDGLMPAPLVLRDAPASPVAPAVSRRQADRRALEGIALAAIGTSFAGLIFALAITAIAHLGIAIIVTAVVLLPLASLVATPSASGHRTVR